MDNSGASPLATGLSPAVEPACAVSPAVAASIPSAWRRTMQMDWSTNTGVVTFTYPGDMSEQDIVDVKALMDVAFCGMVRRAQAIEARRAETHSGFVADESAVPEGCAQDARA